MLAPTTPLPPAPSTPTTTAAIGLPNTLLAVMIHHQDQLVGMGRLRISSGLLLQIVDIAVNPAHQKRGLGKAIVGKLIEYIRQIELDGTYTSLIADCRAKHLYAQFGFVETAPASIGMALSTK